MKKLPFLALLLALIGCSAMRANRLIGKSKYDVLMEYGAPTQIIAGRSEGEEILVYESRQRMYLQGYHPAYTNTAGMSNGDYLGLQFARGFAMGVNPDREVEQVSQRLFYISANGIVYQTSSR